jgi:hypothetical protein
VRSLVPWLCLGLFSIGSAVLIAAGRLGQMPTQAVTVRYISHAIPLTVALIAATWIMIQQRLVRAPGLRSAAAATTGALLMLFVSQWVYGARMMELWSQTRLQGRAIMMFAKLFPEPGPLAHVAGDGAYLKPLIERMEKVRITNPRLLDNLKLSQFSMVRTELAGKAASFDSLELKPNGSMIASGYAQLPSHRPADLVLFTRRKPGTQGETIFALSTLQGIPMYMDQAPKRDHEWLLMPPFTPEWTAQWDEHLAVFSVPAKTDVIDAWAFDSLKMRVYRIEDNRLRPSQGFPRGLFPNSDTK